MHWNCYADKGCIEVDAEAQKSGQDRHENVQEETLREPECHICGQNILLNNQEADMMFCDCDFTFSTFVHINCLRDIVCPS